MGARRTSTALLAVGACFLVAVAAATSVQPLDIEWKDVSCSVGKKQLLQGVSGKARAGKLLAVMGPSGSGKTTLLNALASQVPYSKRMQLHGNLRVGGAERESGQDQAYVKQEDVFYSQLTVREILLMSARLRLPSSMSLDEKTAMVDELMNKLGLSKVADTIVGDEKTRGISGGERKRLSIACQLFGTPSLIFCDEPTTGLDSFQAERVMSTLRQLARDGHTVICSIHQPRSSIFRMFDDLVVLSEGQVVFRGPAKGVAGYFRSKGHSMPANTNPGEFAIDLVSVDYASEDAEEASKRRISRFASDHRDSTPGTTSTASSVGRWLGGASLPSENVQGGVGKGALVAAAPGGAGGGSRKMRRSVRLLKRRSQGAGPLEQFRLLLSRSWKQVNRAKFANMTRVVANLGSAVVFGSIFWKLGLGQSYINDRVGLLQTSVIQCAMSTVAKTLVTFPTESTIVKAERSLKMYGMLPYFLSKMIAELPISALFPTIFGVILYPMTGLHPKRDRFLNFLGVLTIEAFTASAVGMLIGCLAKDGDAALAIGPPIMTIFILFSGFYITQDNVPGPLRWVKDASMIKHAFEALCVNELKGLEFECDTKSRGPCIRTGEQMLERVAFGGSTVAGATLSLSKVLGSCWALTYLTLALGNPRYQTMSDPSLLPAPQPSATCSSSAADASTRVSGGGLTNVLRSNSSSKRSSSKSSCGRKSSSSSNINSKSSSSGGGSSSNIDDEAITTAAVADRVGSGGGGGGGGGDGLSIARAARQWSGRRRRLRRQENRANRAGEGCAATSAGSDPAVVGAARGVARKGAVVPRPRQLRTPKRLQ